MIKLKVDGYKSQYVKPLAKALTSYAKHDGTINIRLADSAEVRRLNKTYAGHDYATDVLSFSYIEDGQTEEFGDIIISSQHLKEQADSAKTPKETEFILLLLHGALHIFGYDHQTEKGRRQMDEVQSKIMQSLGLEYRNFGWLD